MKFFTFLLLSLFLLVQVSAYAQEGGRKKKPWKKSGTSYNPYLERKAKNKPSARMARSDKKELMKQKKAARKQMRRSKRRLNKG